jgi:hypothetical protein
MCKGLKAVLIDSAAFAFIFATVVAYNRKNYLKTVRHITEVYASVKETDVPDSKIIRHEFPKRGIYISYRTWMNIKNMKQSDVVQQPYRQIDMF